MKLLAPFLFIAIALAIAVQLDDTPPDADLVFVNRGDVFTLDPQRQSYIQDFRTTNALFEGLLRWHNDTFEIVPAIADMPEISSDGLTYTFTLRPDAQWSNGDPVIAHDFIYAWKRLLLPDTSADYSNMMFVVRGAEGFWHWRARQTAAFAADPWQAGPEVTATITQGLVDRLDELRLASSLPAGLHWPDDGAGDALRVELDELRALAADLLDAEAEYEAIKRDGEEPDDLDVARRESVRARVAGAVADASTCRRVFDALADPASRAVEARWMWDQASERFRRTVGLEAVDDRTLRVTLRRPCAYFLDLICFGVFFPVYRPCVEGWPDVSPQRGVDPGRGWITRDPPPDFDDCAWVALDPVTGRLEQQHQWARPHTLVCNGPYVLDQWRYKRDMRLHRNPMYYDQDRIRPDDVVAITIEDANTRVLAFETGRIDWLSEVGAEYEADMLAERDAYLQHHHALVKAMKDEGRPMDEILATLPPPGPGERRNVHKFPTFGTDYYGFNCRELLSDGRPNPFRDPAVRRAFVLSVDKESIVHNVTRLNEPVLTTLIPPDSIPGYESPAGLPHDPRRALKELEELAGWVRRPSDGLLAKVGAEDTLFPVVEILWTTNTPRYKWISLELKAQWEKTLGVRVELRGEDTKFYKEDLKQGKFMIARGRWYGDYGDPTTFLDLCKSTDGNNDRKYASDAVDELLREAEEELDPAARLALLAECERIIVQEDVPMLVLCQLVQVYMYEPGQLTGLSQHPRLTQYLWQMKVEK
ncbi:MAG: peptide ABC transporter substrate-binding protein [Planctomycetota bacterium]|jgi:oligopeptide transport system substrate-binding protein